MGNESKLLERTGSYQFSRIVIGKLKIGADLLEGIKEIARQEKIRTGSHLGRSWSPFKRRLPKCQDHAPGFQDEG